MPWYADLTGSVACTVGINVIKKADGLKYMLPHFSLRSKVMALAQRLVNSRLLVFEIKSWLQFDLATTAKFFSRDRYSP